MKDLPLEELMEQVETLFCHVMFFPEVKVRKIALTFDEQGVSVGGYGQFSGLGATAREALLNLRGKLLAEADKYFTAAEAMREVVKGIQRRRGAEVEE